MADTDKIVDQTEEAIANGTALDGKPVNKEMIVCPCCGKTTLEKPLSPDADLLDHFIACMMTGEPYTKEYELFGGRLRIGITQVTTEIARYVENACTILDKWGVLVPARTADTIRVKLGIQRYACVSSIQLEGKTRMRFEPAEAVRKLCEDIRTSNYESAGGSDEAAAIGSVLDKAIAVVTDGKLMSTVADGTLTALLQLHSHIYDMLMESGFDENFWSRIKLA